MPFGDLQLRMARFQALYWAGQAHDLDRFTATGLGLGLADPPPSLAGILAGFRGGALLARGHGAEALAELQRASRLLSESDWFGQRPLAEAMRARAAVFAGELDVADEAISAADAAFVADPVRGARTLPYIELSRAWARAGRGAIGEAADMCLELGSAMEALAKPIAVEVLHAAARLGRAAESIEPLDRLAGDTQGRYADLVAGHVRALTAGDAEGLATAGRGFEGLGLDLLAAEAWRAAANAYARAGKGASSTTAAGRAADLLAVVRRAALRRPRTDHARGRGAHRARARGRDHGRRGPHERRDRRGAVPVRAHRRHPPQPGVPQAHDRGPPPAR